jgi:hypothetical protein
VEHLEPRLEDDAGQLGVGLDGVIYIVQRVQVVEGWTRQPLPVGLWQGIEGLSAHMGALEVGDLGILSAVESEFGQHWVVVNCGIVTV